VHGHWLLARVARLFPSAPVAAPARAALAKSLTREKLAAEAGYLEGKGRASFERPYGLAWLLQLGAELRESDSPHASALAPLEAAAVSRLREWLPKLSYPVRSGEHSQTAFALGLIFDWARTAKHTELAALVQSRARQFYGRDRDCPISYEPSGEDFLSPCLAEADLMRRVLPPDEFGRWLGSFLPGASRSGWLVPVKSPDPSDPKLAHLDGLNLSRAWMLEGIRSGLAAGDPRIPVLEAAAAAHGRAGLDAATGAHYEGGHWLGTFAVYYTTRRGLK
jgi:hypothetical protein